MRDYITGHESDETRADTLAEFEAVQKVAKTMRGTYALVKKWFLDKYKEEYLNADFSKVNDQKQEDSTSEEQSAEAPELAIAG